MAGCPCCGEPLPVTALPNELCASCARAMESGVDAGPLGPYGNLEHPFLSSVNAATQRIPIHRPSGVTLIALCFFLIAIGVLVFTVSAIPGLLVGESSVQAKAVALAPVCLGLLAAWVVYFIGSAFRRLREWARLLIIALSCLSLVVGGLSSEWWSRGLHLALIVYLMRPTVKAAFLAASEQDEPIIVDRWFVGSHKTARG